MTNDPRIAKSALTGEQWVLLFRLLQSILTKVSQNFEVVVRRASVWLAVVELTEMSATPVHDRTRGTNIEELAHDKPLVAAILVQVCPQWRAVRLIVVVRTTDTLARATADRPAKSVTIDQSTEEG